MINPEASITSKISHNTYCTCYVYMYYLHIIVFIIVALFLPNALLCFQSENLAQTVWMPLQNCNLVPGSNSIYYISSCCCINCHSVFKISSLGHVYLETSKILHFSFFQNYIIFFLFLFLLPFIFSLALLVTTQCPPYYLRPNAISGPFNQELRPSSQPCSLMNTVGLTTKILSRT